MVEAHLQRVVIGRCAVTQKIRGCGAAEGRVFRLSCSPCSTDQSGIQVVAGWNLTAETA